MKLLHLNVFSKRDSWIAVVSALSVRWSLLGTAFYSGAGSQCRLAWQITLKRFPPTRSENMCASAVSCLHLIRQQMVNMPPDDWVHRPSAASFGIKYKEASGSSVADGFKQELGGKLWLTAPQCPLPLPSRSHWWLNGVNRRDRVLTPLSGQNLRPITFSVCSNCGSSVDSAGGKRQSKSQIKRLSFNPLDRVGQRK